MDMNGGTVLGGNSKHLHDFPMRCARRVVHAHAFGQRASSKALVYRRGNLIELFGGSSAMRGIAGREHATLRVAHHSHTHGNVADAYTKIDRSEEHTSELQSRSDLVCRL